MCINVYIRVIYRLTLYINLKKFILKKEKVEI